MIYFTADTHFGDPRVLRIDRRPFASIAEHDLALMSHWNTVVTQDDDIWHLGDVMSARTWNCNKLLGKLNGRKHLIVGNNDPAETTGADGWTSVQHYVELKHGAYHLILCHYAFRTWNQMGKGSINLHGHSHGRLKPVPRQFDVGVDARALRPVSLERLLVPPKRDQQDFEDQGKGSRRTEPSPGKTRSLVS